MAQYELTDEQQQILLQLVKETPFKGDVSEKITAMKQALRRRVPKEPVEGE